MINMQCLRRSGGYRHHRLISILLGFILASSVMVIGDMFHADTNTAAQETSADGYCTRSPDRDLEPLRTVADHYAPLPVWGICWHLKSEWIPDTMSSSTVAATMQSITDTIIKPAHLRVLRMDVNVMKAVDANGTVALTKVRWLANFCLWAHANDIGLIPILGGTGEYDDGKEGEYVDKVYRFVYEFAKTLGRESPDAYARILSFEVENEMNHEYHHGGWSLDAELALLTAGSNAVRQAERDAFQDWNIALNFTPITVNFSIDWVWVTGNAYTHTLSYFSSVRNGGTLDVIGIDFYPGTWSTGDAGTLVSFVKYICQNTPELVIVGETGMSTGKSGVDEETQREFYRIATERFLDYYYLTGGREDGFRGVCWYELFNADNNEEADPIMLVERNFGLIDSTGGSHGGDGGYQYKLVYDWLCQRIGFAAFNPGAEYLRITSGDLADPSVSGSGALNHSMRTFLIEAAVNSSSSPWPSARQPITRADGGGGWSVQTENVAVFVPYEKIVFGWSMRLELELSGDQEENASFVIRTEILAMTDTGNWHPLPIVTINPQYGDWCPPGPGTNITFDWNGTVRINTSIFGNDPPVNRFHGYQVRMDLGVRSDISIPSASCSLAVTQNIPPLVRLPDEYVTSVRPLANAEIMLLEPLIADDFDGLIRSYDWQITGTGATMGYQQQFNTSGSSATLVVPPGGTYLVTLGIVDDGGLLSSAAAELRVNPVAFAPVADAGPDQSANSRVVALDGSASGNPFGDPMVYYWDFDARDGTGIGQDQDQDQDQGQDEGEGEGEGLLTTDARVNHTYPAPGMYRATLTVIWVNNWNASDQDECVIRINSPPTARFSISGAIENQTRFYAQTFTTITFTSAAVDSDGYLQVLEWSFGDGATAAGAEVSHSYQDNGVFVVTLTATDNSGVQSRANHTLIIQNRPPAITAIETPGYIAVGETAAFRAVVNDTDGMVVGYEWRFGDTDFTSTGPGITVTFDTIGTYQLVLIVWDDDNASVSDMIEIEVLPLPPPPTANIQCALDTVLTLEEITVTGSGSTDPAGLGLEMRWALGDGTPVINGSSLTGENLQINHTYTVPGTYSIILEVIDGFGRTDGSSHTIHVLNRPPVARIMIRGENETNVPGRIEITANQSFDSDGEVTDYFFDFGDGTNATIHAPNSAVFHTYAMHGEYTIRVRIRDNNGSWSELVGTIVTVRQSSPAEEDQGTAAGETRNANTVMQERLFWFLLCVIVVVGTIALILLVSTRKQPR